MKVEAPSALAVLKEIATPLRVKRLGRARRGQCDEAGIGNDRLGVLGRRGTRVTLAIVNRVDHAFDSGLGADAHRHAVDREHRCRGQIGKTRAAHRIADQNFRAEVDRVHAGKRESDGLVGVGADLKLRVGKSTVEQFSIVELHRARQAVQLGEDIAHLGVQRRAVGGAVGIVGRLNRQLTSALQQV